jgi:phospholipid/cholesterol/gamma-HCH transport system permease protein
VLGGWIDRIGAAALGELRYGLALGAHLVAGLSAGGRAGGERVVQRATLYQVYFTGVDAVAVVAALASILGGLVIAQSLGAVSGRGGEVLLGNILEMVVVRELGPLMTAFLVIGRSGSSVAVELGNMQVAGEVDLLRGLGIDIHRYLVFPRLVGITTATFALCLLFDLAAVLGGFAVARMAIDTPASAFLSVVAMHVSPTDLLVSGAKTILFGLWIATVSTWQGLAAGSAITEVPQATRRAVVHSLFGCLVLNLAMTATVYGVER